MNPILKANPGLTKTLLCIGECMVEMAPQEGGLFAMGFAGDTFNTAWYARQALPQEWRVSYFTAVGTDDVSDRMIAFMRGAGVDTSAVLRLRDRTVGLYMISLKGAERSFSYWRSASAAKALADDPAHLEQALADADVAYFSGITLAILDADARGRLFAALAKARAAGKTVVFDPNLRLRLWPSAQVMCGAIMQAAAVSDVVLPSHEDEATFFGDASPEATARRYLEAGAATVVVKDGPGEVLLARGAERLRFQPEPVAQVVDTTAAGDSFNAGFLGALLSGQGDLAAMRAGAEMAGRVIGARGALIRL